MWQNGFPFYGWTICHHTYGTKCNHILFIHPFVDSYLGCFHLLPIVNYITMNMGLQIPVWVSIFNSFGYIEVELLDHVVLLYLTFWEITILFSLVTILFYIPTRVHKDPASPHALHHLLLSMFLIIVILMDIQMYLSEWCLIFLVN